MSHLYQFLLAFLLFYLVSSDFCGPWDAIDWKTMPMPKPDDTIEVRYVVAPLLYCSYKDLFSLIGGYHAGIAFVNKNTNYGFTLNYDAFPVFGNAIVPDIIVYPNGTKDLVWQNFGRVFVYEGINATYWHNANQVVGSMTGAQLLRFLSQFVANTNTTFPYYNLWRVYDHPNGKMLLDNYSCFNFVWSCFLEIQKLGGTILPNLHLNQSFGVAYSAKNPEKVNYNDAKARDDIIKFYEAIEGKIKDLGILGFFLELFEIAIDGVFYVRNSTDYYKIDVHSPYVRLVYVDIPVPYIKGKNRLIN